MPPKKVKEVGRTGANVAAAPGGDEAVDPTRAAFTSAIVAALKDLENKKAPTVNDLGQQAYQKLQYDLPLVSAEELEGLAATLRASLQLKSGPPPFPLTSKMLENIVTGARPPLATTAVTAAAAQPSVAAAADTSRGEAGGAAAPGADLGHAAPTPGGLLQDDEAAVLQATAPPPQTPPPDSLLEPGLLRADQQHLCGGFRVLCAAVFVQLVSHCLSVSEQDTWALLHGMESDSDDDVASSAGEEGRGGAGEQRASVQPAGHLQRLDHEGANGSSRPTDLDPGPGGSRSDAVQHSGGPDGARGHDGSADGSADDTAVQQVLQALQLQTGAGEAGGPPTAPPQPACQLYDEPEAEEDGDDFVFEDLEAPGPSTSSATSTTALIAAGGVGGSWALGRLPAGLPPPPPPPYTWPALRSCLLRLAGQVSYALLDEQDLWRDGELLQGVFQLLRALGAHRHAQELQPVLHAYVGLVADRIAAEPQELACLDSLWDAVGVSCIASLPQVGRQRQAGGGGRGQGLLLAEATTCLSLVSTLAGQLMGAAARLRLWQQVHRHVMPLLERCLAELARAVGPGQGPAAARAATAAAAAAAEQPEPKRPGPEEVAAIVLVCQVLDFYVQQRPGNVDLVAALKGTGVLASLSMLFAAAGGLPGAEPLRSAALCCAASSGELHDWMLAVPGVAGVLAGPAFQAGGPCEAHGAVWQLLSRSAGDALALRILAGGAAPEEAVRVHALLQLLAKAAACRGGGGRGGGGAALWTPGLERAMRELFAALRQEQAASSAAASSRVPTGATTGKAEGQCGAAAQANGGGEELAAAPLGHQAGSDEVHDDGGGGEDPDGSQEDEEDDKLHLLDPAALQRRRARQLHPACWRILKQLLATGGDAGGKTD